MRSFEVKGPIGHFHTSCHAQTMESLVLPSENSHFSMLTSSRLHLTSDGFGSKVAPSATTVTASLSSVANRGAHKTVAGLAFGAQISQDCNLTLSIHLHGESISGLKCHPMSSKVPSDTFIPHVMPKQWNHWFYFRTTHTFRWSPAHFCTQNVSLWGLTLHLRWLP